MRKASADSRMSRTKLALAHVAILGIAFIIWYGLTTPGVVSEAYANKIAFFFGRPLQVIRVVFDWFVSGKIYPHLAITLWETLLAFAAGSVLGLGVGLWLLFLPPAPPPRGPPPTPLPPQPPARPPPPLFLLWCVWVGGVGVRGWGWGGR